MKFSTIVKVASGIVAIAATGVAIYNKTKAEKLEGPKVTEEDLYEMDKALKTEEIASRVAIGAAVAFAGASIASVISSHRKAIIEWVGERFVFLVIASALDEKLRTGAITLDDVSNLLFGAVEAVA